MLAFLCSGCQSLAFAIGGFFLEAVKAAVIAAFIGGGLSLTLLVTGAPKPLTQAVGLSIASLAFALLTLKALWVNLNNLRWSLRNNVRNRHRKR